MAQNLEPCQPQMSLGASKRKILRKISGPICVHGEYRRRMNYELYELYDDVELARRVQRLHWLAHVVRMDGQAAARRVFETDSSGRSRRNERPDGYDINSLGIST